MHVEKDMCSSFAEVRFVKFSLVCDLIGSFEPSCRHTNVCVVCTGGSIFSEKQIAQFIHSGSRALFISSFSKIDLSVFGQDHNYVDTVFPFPGYG